jgi:hypothetical protein
MNTSTDLHPAHAAAKLRMAQRLATHLRGVGLGDPQVIAWSTAERRTELAREAGESHDPSESTWAMVVVLLETRPTVAVVVDGSEFEGLPL